MQTIDNGVDQEYEPWNADALTPHQADLAGELKKIYHLPKADFAPEKI